MVHTAGTSPYATAGVARASKVVSSKMIFIGILG